MLGNGSGSYNLGLQGSSKEFVQDLLACSRGECGDGCLEDGELCTLMAEVCLVQQGVMISKTQIATALLYVIAR